MMECWQHLEAVNCVETAELLFCRCALMHLGIIIKKNSSSSLETLLMRCSIHLAPISTLVYSCPWGKWKEGLWAPWFSSKRQGLHCRQDGLVMKVDEFPIHFNGHTTLENVLDMFENNNSMTTICLLARTCPNGISSCRQQPTIVTPEQSNTLFDHILLLNHPTFCRNNSKKREMVYHE